MRHNDTVGVRLDSITITPSTGDSFVHSAAALFPMQASALSFRRRDLACSQFRVQQGAQYHWDFPGCVAAKAIL